MNPVIFIYSCLLAIAVFLGQTPLFADSKLGDEITIALPDGTPITFCYIPPGEFTMGSSANELKREGDETPHKVTLTKPFWMGQHEVMQIQWQAVMGDNPVVDSEEAKRDGALGIGDVIPVYYISWDACQAFLAKLNQLGLGGTFRLPTEAEWEYACRAGNAARYYWGDDPEEKQIDDYAWYKGNDPMEGAIVAGLKKPNDWALFDLCGNVWEWCQDWYGAYPSGDCVDPSGPAEGTGRVIRGGGWINPPEYLRSANRNWCPINTAKYFVGVRLVFIPKG